MRTQRELLKLMMTMREFERVIKEMARQRLVEGAIHCYTGEEAIAAGVCQNLRDDDYVFSTHRGHGHAIAKGCDLNAIFAELMGRSTGLSGGMGGSMHLFDVKKGLMGGNGIVGGGAALSLGTAYASKYRGDDRVTVCFFSDGASNEGWCHEAMNMAALWKLPVLFACENNLFAATTPAFKTLSNPDLYQRAAGYGMPGAKVDGNDLDECIEKSAEALVRARRGEGPTLLEFKTYRVEGHCMVLNDLPAHRSPDEVAAWAARDPIDRYARRLIDSGVIKSDDLQSIAAEIAAEFERALRFGNESPRPDEAAFLARVGERYAL